MSKVTIIGAGSVGSTSALRIIEANLADVLLIDITKDIPRGKACDLEDAAWLSRHNHFVYASDTYEQMADSDIIVITAGFPRKPGMNREDLRERNGQIIRQISAELKNLDSEPIIIVVTNPVDIMTYMVMTLTGINPKRILGMGIALDASRFANLIRKELKCSISEIEPLVIGAHGKDMLPLPRLTYVKGKSLNELLSKDKVDDLVKKTKDRGAEIVAYLKNGSAFFAPSAAIYGIVKAILFDERRTIGASAYLNGEYGLEDVCIGVPVVVGKEGIDKIIELDLDPSELGSFKKSAEELKKCMISV
jgi:malate dehydrogenase